jgi:hypothetical protein
MGTKEGQWEYHIESTLCIILVPIKRARRSEAKKKIGTELVQQRGSN